MPRTAVLTDAQRARLAPLLPSSAGRRGRPKPALSVAWLAATAVRIADAEGLAAVSMQRVARGFGYTTMSLYRYVASKDELMNAAVDMAAGTPPQPGPDDEPWRDGITRWGHALWVVYQEHPWVLRVRVSGPPSGPNHLAWLEFALRKLGGSGLPPAENLSTIMFLLAAVRDFARITTEQQRLRQDLAGRPDGGYGAQLDQILDTDLHPALAGLIGSPAFAGEEPDDGDLLPYLDFGLQRLLDGIEAHVDRQRGDRGSDDPDRGGVPPNPDLTDAP